MIKRISVLLAIMLTLLMGASALAEPVLCQGYSAPITGEIRRVNVFLDPDAGLNEDFEQIYFIEIDGLSQPDKMVFANAESPSDVELLRFIDINFDGYTDIAALHTAGASDSFASFFVFDPQAGAFGRNEALDGISLFRAELYPLQGLILNYVHDGAATGTWELYDWNGEGRSLRLLRTASIMFEDFEMTAMRDTVIEYAPDGAQTVLYDDVHPVIEDDDEYGDNVDALLDMLWQGYDGTEAPVYMESLGGLMYRTE